MDNLGVALLVTDPDSDEILFANDAMNLSYGVKGSPTGKTCYAAYGEDPARKCSFCPSEQLKKNPSQPIMWERYHRNVKKWFRHTDILTNWNDGQQIHIQSVVDITHEKEEELSVARQKAQHELMASIAREFAVLKDNVYEQIHHAFEITGAFLKIDRILLLKKNPGSQDVAIECAWFKSEKFKPDNTRKELPPQLDFGRYGKSHKEYITCDIVAKEPKYAVLEQYGVISFLAVPVWTNAADTRFISFETCAKVKPIENAHIHLATILGDIVGNAMIRVADIEKIIMARRQAQTLLDATPFSCVLLDENRKIVDCNLYALRNSGFESKEAFIENFMDLATEVQEDGEASADFLQAQFEQAVEKGSASFRWNHATMDGRVVPLQVSMVRVPWETGFRIAAYGRSLTREFDELEKRRIAEKQIQVMLDSNPLICSMWDEQLTMIDCNLAAVRLLGMDDKSEYIGHFFQFNPTYQPDGEPSKAKAIRWLRQVLKTGQERFEWEYLTRSGQPFPAETTLIRVDWDYEYRILAYSRDLRELKAAESEKKEAEQRTLLMLDTLPMASYLIARNHELVDCNREAVRMFQAKDKEHLIHSFLEDFSPDYQLDGQPSKEKANRFIDRAFSEGYVVFDWTHQMPSGDVIPAEIILVHVHWKENEDLVCAYTRDLRQVKRTEGELHQKTLLLETVNRIAERLLPANPSNIDQELSLSMKYLAQSVNVDAVRIWKNTEENGKSCYQLVHGWPQALASSSYETKYYDDLPYWKDMIFNNRIINGPVQDLPDAEKVLLADLEVKSILVIPLTILDKVWGFVSFEDHRHVRVLTESEEHALRSGSTILASALHRNATTRELIDTNIALTKNKNLLSAVNRVAELILSSEREDFPRVIQKSLKLIGESVGGDRASLWEIHQGKDGILYANRLPGWKKGRSFKNSEYALTIPLYDYVPEWRGENAPHDIEFLFDEMNENLQGMSILEGGKYLLLQPLSLQEHFWGFVGIAHKTEGLHFNEGDRDIIRSGSLMIAESIIRSNLSANLQEIEVIAATDALTGLMNRASFLPQAEAMFDSSKQNEKPICVMFLDIDHFKKVNDNYGHAFGDTVLVQMASILKNSVRPHDLCARYGGEEFVIVLAEGSRVAAEKVAGRIMQALRSARFEQYPEFSFTVSIGLMSNVPKDEETLQLFIESADLALYNAKNTGRNKVVNYLDMPQE
ncbi:diguanylate cyclase [Ruminococcaceae bacterium OttesenSCG-928-I18]|nr:diguanylate cyclase [Ruminococcaceae bacterium OttesenSCG-928-I18]